MSRDPKSTYYDAGRYQSQAGAIKYTCRFNFKGSSGCDSVKKGAA